MRSVVALVTVGSLLSGCGAGPRPEAPGAAAVVAPAGWRGQSEPGAAIEARWWQAFGDPVLDALVVRALDRNTDIALAAERVAEARGQLALARAQLLPSLGLGAGGGRQRDVDAFGRPREQWAGEAELSLSWEVDLFGRLASGSAAARANLLATEAGRQSVRLATVAATVGGYVGVRALDARLAILRETLASRAEARRIARRRAEAGYTSRLELAQAEAEYRATEQLIAPTELAIARQENALSILLGETPGEIERGADLAAVAVPPVPDRLPSELLRQRPDILEAEQRIVAADHSLDAARAAFLPRIELAADGGYVASNLLSDPIGIFSLGGSILAPLFQGGRLSAQADIAASRRDQAAFAYRRTVLVAFQEVEDARAAIAAAARQEAVLAAQRDVLADAFTLASSRYRAGYASYLDQLDAQRNLLNAELGIVQARADRLGATVQLYRALGGGWAPDIVDPAGRS